MKNKQSYGLQLNANDWLDLCYSKNGSICQDIAGKKVFGMKRNEVEFLCCNVRDQLKGELDLTEFTNLNYIFIINNSELINIKLPYKMNNLIGLDISYNCITSLNFIFNSDFPNLEIFNSSGNYHEAYNISKFAKFNKLRIISINYSNFYGSLKSLSNLTNLNEIEITETNINEGLEYLPTNVKHVSCNTKKWFFDSIDFSRKSIKIAESMRIYKWDYQTWRKNNIEEVVCLIENLSIREC